MVDCSIKIWWLKLITYHSMISISFLAFTKMTITMALNAMETKLHQLPLLVVWFDYYAGFVTFEAWNYGDLSVLVYSWSLSVSAVLDTGLNSLSFFLKVWMIPLHNQLVWLHFDYMDNDACTEKPWWSSGENHHPFNSGVLYVKRKVGACSYVDDPIGSQSLLSRAMHKVYTLHRS